MTPEEHYARGIDLLDLAERSTEMFQIQANAVLAQTHFSAAAAGAGMRSMADYLEVERDRIAAADHHARPAEVHPVSRALFDEDPAAYEPHGHHDRTGDGGPRSVLGDLVVMHGPYGPGEVQHGFKHLPLTDETKLNGLRAELIALRDIAIRAAGETEA